MVSPYNILGTSGYELARVFKSHPFQRVSAQKFTGDNMKFNDVHTKAYYKKSIFNLKYTTHLEII